jgi:hypothetical protein
MTNKVLIQGTKAIKQQILLGLGPNHKHGAFLRNHYSTYLVPHLPAPIIRKPGRQ